MGGGGVRVCGGSEAAGAPHPHPVSSMMHPSHVSGHLQSPVRDRIHQTPPRHNPFSTRHSSVFPVSGHQKPILGSQATRTRAHYGHDIR